MKTILCDVVIPVVLYPIMYWPFTVAGMVLIAAAIILWRYLKKRKQKEASKKEDK